MKGRGTPATKTVGGLTMSSVIAALAAFDQVALAVMAGVVVFIVFAVCWIVADVARASNLALVIRALGDRRSARDGQDPVEGGGPAAERHPGRRARAHAG